MAAHILIVGQGLAGSLLSRELSARGHRLTVLDDGHASASTAVAAGLINPVTGQRHTLEPDWHARRAAAEALYNGPLAEAFGRPFLYPRPALRLLGDDREREKFATRRDSGELDGVLAAEYPPGHWESGGLHDPHGSFTVEGSGYVDLPALLAVLREELRTQGALREETFAPERLVPGSRSVRYTLASGETLEADAALFCEGHRARNNPFFAEAADMRPVKGEILTLRPESPLPPPLDTHLVNGGAWLLPLEGGLYRAGATYKPDVTEAVPTLEGEAQILARLGRFLPGGRFTVVDHRAGIRPRTFSGRETCAFHPQYPRLGAFNGFGSKGSLRIPQAARRFAEEVETRLGG